MNGFDRCNQSLDRLLAQVGALRDTSIGGLRTIRANMDGLANEMIALRDDMRRTNYTILGTVLAGAIIGLLGVFVVLRFMHL